MCMCIVVVVPSITNAYNNHDVYSHNICNGIFEFLMFLPVDILWAAKSQSPADECIFKNRIYYYYSVVRITSFVYMLRWPANDISNKENNISINAIGLQSNRNKWYCTNTTHNSVLVSCLYALDTLLFQGAPSSCFQRYKLNAIKHKVRFYDIKIISIIFVIYKTLM